MKPEGQTTIKSLKGLRRGWEERSTIEASLPLNLTIQESIARFLELYRLFGDSLRRNDTLFRPEREAALAELQQRLQCIAAWQRKQDGKSI